LLGDLQQYQADAQHEQSERRPDHRQAQDQSQDQQNPTSNPQGSPLFARYLAHPKGKMGRLCGLKLVFSEE
jgi:hypothetical protein